MNEPSYEKFIPMVRDGGCVVVNSSLIEDRDYPDNVRVYAVNATNVANDMKNSRGANLVMLGAMMKATGLLDPEAFGQGLNAYFDQKGHNTPQNLECYKAGMAQAVPK